MSRMILSVFLLVASVDPALAAHPGLSDEESATFDAARNSVPPNEFLRLGVVAIALAVGEVCPDKTLAAKVAGLPAFRVDTNDLKSAVIVDLGRKGTVYMMARNRESECADAVKLLARLQDKTR